MPWRKFSSLSLVDYKSRHEKSMQPNLLYSNIVLFCLRRLGAESILGYLMIELCVAVLSFVPALCHVWWDLCLCNDNHGYSPDYVDTLHNSVNN